MRHFILFSLPPNENTTETETQKMGLKIGGHIEKVNGKEVSYSHFVERYLVKNQPVVLTGLMDGWRACKDWVLDDGQPNLSFFSTHFGNSTVQVADCGTREFTDQKRVEMSVSEFIDYWLDFDNASTHEFDAKSPLYLKDWHFVKEYPEYLAYTTPPFFQDDWLNLCLDKYRMHKDADTYQEKNEISCSDYRFVYMGAKGTWTPLHADVFRSYSWSANVCGKKQWHFLSPCQCHLVFDRNMKCSIYDIFKDVSETKFPGFEKAIWLECTQEQNEIIFVPSGWYHQVHNLEDTISINHNWFNAYNLCWVWDLLFRDYNEAKEYIEDIKDICDDFEGLCQRNLAANTGMNFQDFFIFIARFSFANLVLLYLLVREYENSIRSSSQRACHIVFNLKSARNIALKMKSIDLSGNSGISTNFKENIRGFHIPILPESCKLNDISEALSDDLMDIDLIESSASHVCTPEDLVILIDYAFTKFSSRNVCDLVNNSTNEWNILTYELDNLGSSTPPTVGFQLSKGTLSFHETLKRFVTFFCAVHAHRYDSTRKVKTCNSQGENVDKSNELDIELFNLALKTVILYLVPIFSRTPSIPSGTSIVEVISPNIVSTCSDIVTVWVISKEMEVGEREEVVIPIDNL
ncbi:hypothetical protein HYC85_004754 [Camellia sinensis]|uniref:JmjC domain-containing protein n=1 Tax=Camellia sinensis TaxID=4442 RepID=A0A7J7HY03_CAMSI|nr:hypothetical protein HYC85_004754 [Camellia sinensis]